MKYLHMFSDNAYHYYFAKL